MRRYVERGKSSSGRCYFVANTQHVEAWHSMLAESQPPIVSTPITPYLGLHSFRSE